MIKRQELNQETDLKNVLFVNPPSLSKLDDLESFYILGLDLKITNSKNNGMSDRIKLIETNGFNSGLTGLESLGVSRRSEVISRIKEYGLWHYYYLGMNFHVRRMPECFFAETKDFSKLFIEDYGNILKSNINPSWMRYNKIFENILDFESIVKQKFELEKHYESIRDIKVNAYEATPDNYDFIMSDRNTNFVIAKPKVGITGDGIKIIKSKKDSLVFHDYMMIEPFIESKPIYSSVTGDLHDGCMRYLVLVEHGKDDSININHFGGYWRLCNLPISEYGNLDAMRANLSKNSIPELANEKDLLLAKELVDTYIPTFCRSVFSDMHLNFNRSLDEL